MVVVGGGLLEISGTVLWLFKKNGGFIGFHKVESEMLDVMREVLINKNVPTSKGEIPLVCLSELGI